MLEGKNITWEIHLHKLRFARYMPPTFRELLAAKVGWLKTRIRLTTLGRDLFTVYQDPPGIDGLRMSIHQRWLKGAMGTIMEWSSMPVAPPAELGRSWLIASKDLPGNRPHASS